MLAEKFFIYPDSIDYGSHPKYDRFLNVEELFFSSYDKTKLHGWYVSSSNISPCQGTFVHFHGNAGNITNHWEFVKWIPKNGFDLLTFDYRGFGRSQGTANFEGIMKDCLAAISFARTRSNGNIFLLGQSLGSAFCLKAAAEDGGKDLKGIIIDSGFGSFVEIASSKLTGLPTYISWCLTKFLVNDRFSPVSVLSNLTMPKLFIHGKHDRVVEFSHGEKLYQNSPHPKQFLEIPDGNHLSVFLNLDRVYMLEVVNFLDSCLHN